MPSSEAHTWWLSIAAGVVIVAGMQAAADILAPLLLSLFIAMICWPLVDWLYQRKMPAWGAIAIVMLGLIVAMTLIGLFLGQSINHFIDNLPYYQTRLQASLGVLVEWLQDLGIDVSQEEFEQTINAGRLMGFAGTLLTTLTNAFANTALILFYVTFMFMEAFILPAKLQAAFSVSSRAFRFERFFANLRRYLRLKTLVSLATGVAVALWLTFLGVDYPILWGSVAFVLNFIPNIGSFIAAIPGILLALVQLGPEGAFYTALGYLVVNTVIGGLIDPRVVGSGLGLSTLVVFLSLIFWGWILGPVGMFLSVPITVVGKMLLEEHPQTRWIAALLGDGRIRTGLPD
ncbi:AI-2 transport protein TqsA [Methylomarinovum tepidoasis]|uniref:AI-2 transport protein TqsA n=1 Tax=Methylomarinovum tepidoasis TaxID=2840183 RepID=A0AAU9BY48_9GAMM|nr:AI-2E family transporter [Methylomarinovum sp. IN45]BCX88655.1 AI-2 transport protein TqsA [Methylomarinovum sp. IN45]